MEKLTTLSTIGFGGYRISSENFEHIGALQLALDNGCTLIDTAPNYANGESETLIGKIAGEKAFIVTKAGYIQGLDIKRVAHLKPNTIFKFSNNFLYSIDVNFIRFQLNNSLQRLKRKYVDAYLLHNPEHILAHKAQTKSELYDAIRHAFAFLEEKVHEGVIGCYGISSNTLPQSQIENDTLSLNTLLDLAANVSTSHHFRIIQFPYNLLEDQATSAVHDNGETLVAIAKTNGITTFTNRPLNAKSPSGVVRFATYHDEYADLDKFGRAMVYDPLFAQIHAQLGKHGMAEKWREFPILTHLDKNWSRIANPEAVEKILNEHFVPFLNSLFAEGLPTGVKSNYDMLKQGMVMHSKKTMTENALQLVEKHDEIKKYIEEYGSLSRGICELYLSRGIDHVLVGMRSEKYVRNFHPFRKR